jgi:4'-phosphopantetheinyl transferase
MATQCALYWLSQTRADIPAGSGWLTPREQAFAKHLKTEKRHADWMLGRWTAKRALRTYLSLTAPKPDFLDIDVRAAADGAPEAFLGEARCGAAISLSHSAGVGLCVVTEKTVTPGCDVEFIEDRSERFISDYFLAGERRFVLEGDPANRALLATLIWSAKESALKVLRRGLRRDTRSVRVRPGTARDPKAWNTLSVTCTETNQQFYGWWCIGGGYVATIAADADIGVPISLMGAGLFQDSSSTSNGRSGNRLD